MSGQQLQTMAPGELATLERSVFTGAIDGITGARPFAGNDPAVLWAQAELAIDTSPAMRDDNEQLLARFYSTVRGLGKVIHDGLIADAAVGQDLAYTLVTTATSPTSMLRYLYPRNVGMTRLGRALTPAELTNVLTCYDDLSDPVLLNDNELVDRRPSIATIVRAADIAGVSLELPVVEDNLNALLACIESLQFDVAYTAFEDSEDGPIGVTRWVSVDASDTGLASDAAVNPIAPLDLGSGRLRDGYLHDYEALSGANPFGDDAEGWRSPKR